MCTFTAFILKNHCNFLCPWGCERTLSPCVWGVAGLISPSSSSALHLLTWHATPADLSTGQSPFITPLDRLHSFRVSSGGEEEPREWQLGVITLLQFCVGERLILDNKNDRHVSWSTSAPWQIKISTSGRCEGIALSKKTKHNLNMNWFCRHRWRWGADMNVWFLVEDVVRCFVNTENGLLILSVWNKRWQTRQLRWALVRYWRTRSFGRNSIEL